MNLGSLMPWRDRSHQMPARREDTEIDPFVAFRREVDRMFDDFMSGFGGRNGLRPMTPVVDMTEKDKELVVTAELPGLDEKDFEVTLMGDVMTIKGEKKSEHEEKNGDATCTERRYGSFSRSIRLPFEVDDEQVDAHYDKGVLTVRVPKPADAQHAVRRIEVKKAA